MAIVCKGMAYAYIYGTVALWLAYRYVFHLAFTLRRLYRDQRV